MNQQKNIVKGNALRKIGKAILIFVVILIALGNFTLAFYDANGNADTQTDLSTSQDGLRCQPQR